MAARLKKNVFLVGFMGAGKSSVARKLARTCGVASLDMDGYIERAQGRKIREIFAKEGEGAFREIETETLRAIAEEGEPMVVSCGGGVVLAEENRRIMRENGHVIHLAIDADEAAARISDKTSRPLFNDIESARQLCDSRMPLYEDAADFTVLTFGKNVTSIAREVESHLREEGILCRQRG